MAQYNDLNALRDATKNIIKGHTNSELYLVTGFCGKGPGTYVRFIAQSRNPKGTIKTFSLMGLAFPVTHVVTRICHTVSDNNERDYRQFFIHVADLVRAAADKNMPRDEFDLAFDDYVKGNYPNDPNETEGSEAEHSENEDEGSDNAEPENEDGAEHSGNEDGAEESEADEDDEALVQAVIDNIHITDEDVKAIDDEVNALLGKRSPEGATASATPAKKQKTDDPNWLVNFFTKWKEGDNTYIYASDGIPYKLEWKIYRKTYYLAKEVHGICGEDSCSYYAKAKWIVKAKKTEGTFIEALRNIQTPFQHYSEEKPFNFATGFQLGGFTKHEQY